MKFSSKNIFLGAAVAIAAGFGMANSAFATPDVAGGQLISQATSTDTEGLLIDIDEEEVYFLINDEIETYTIPVEDQEAYGFEVGRTYTISGEGDEMEFASMGDSLTTSSDTEAQSMEDETAAEAADVQQESGAMGSMGTMGSSSSSGSMSGDLSTSSDTEAQAGEDETAAEAADVEQSTMGSSSSSTSRTTVQQSTTTTQTTPRVSQSTTRPAPAPAPAPAPVRALW